MDEAKFYPSRPSGSAPSWWPRQVSGPILTPDTRSIVPGGFKPLSKEEQEESKNDVVLDDWYVIRKGFTSHRFEPTLTIKEKSITFNNACISNLEQIVYVQLLIDPRLTKIAIRPCQAGDKDAIRWCIAKGEKRKSREISCEEFTEKLYRLMGWKEVYRYKLLGFRKRYRDDPVYVFDLTEPEIYVPQNKATNTKARSFFPEEWGDSFGLTFLEHEESQNINLDNNIRMSELNGTVEIGEEDYVDITEAQRKMGV